MRKNLFAGSWILCPKKGIFRRESDKEELHALVREVLRLPNNEPVTLEYLIEYAKARRIEIPYNTNGVQTKIDKCSIQWSNVNKIGFSDLGKCIILNKAVEAEKRRITTSRNKKVSYKSTGNLSGKTVIDSEANIVGSASIFLIKSRPGMLIHIERLMGRIHANPNALERALIPSMFKDSTQLYEKVGKDLNLKVVTEDDLLLWARKIKLMCRLKTLNDERR